MVMLSLSKAKDERMAARILLVEDNPDNQILIRDILDTLDYEVLIASDGREGVAKAKSEHPDLILMDLSLPVIDGWTATQMIRADSSIGNVKIIAVTAHAMVGDRERALQIGCNAYISKPIDFLELKTTIAEQLA